MSITVPVWAAGATAEDTLVVDGRDTGVPVWTARTRHERNRGLLGTDGLSGGLWITRCNAVHCVGMRYAIDVVYLTGRGRVLSVRTMRPGRIGRPRFTAAATLELPAGRAGQLGVRRGSVLARSSDPGAA